MKKQHTVIRNTATQKGISMIAIKRPVGILNLEYRYRFWGLPKGVSIPPRFAAMFCIIKVNAI